MTAQLYTTRDYVPRGHVGTYVCTYSQGDTTTVQARTPESAALLALRERMGSAVTRVRLQSSVPIED